MKKLKVILSLVVIIFCMMLLCSCDGIRSVNGKKFCYQNNEMITGWYKTNNGEYYYFCEDEKEIDNRKFEKGEMLNGVVIEIDGVLYAFDNSGQMCKGKWINYEDYSMYVDYDGHIVRNETREFDGSRYEFDYKGVAKFIPDYSLTIVPSLPHTFSSYFGDVTIESIDVEWGEYDYLHTYWSGTCGISKGGPLISSKKSVGWKLYDPEGYLIDSGAFYTDDMKTGDIFKRKLEDISYDSNEKGNYKLELMND